MIKSTYIKSLLERAKKDLKTIVLPEGEDERVLTAAHMITAEKAAKVIILGDVEKIKEFYAEKNWDLTDIELVKPEEDSRLSEYTELLYNLRKEKGQP